MTWLWLIPIASFLGTLAFLACAYAGTRSEPEADETEYTPSRELSPEEAVRLGEGA